MGEISSVGWLVEMGRSLSRGRSNTRGGRALSRTSSTVSRANSRGAGSTGSLGDLTGRDSTVRRFSREDAPVGRRFVEVSVAASGLEPGVGGEGVVYAVVERRCEESGEVVLLGKTETVWGEKNPNFVTALATPCEALCFADQTVMVTFNRKMRRGLGRSEKVSLGKVECSLYDLVMSAQKCIDLPLLPVRPDGTAAGVAFVSAEEFRSLQQAPDMVSLRFAMHPTSAYDRESAYIFVVSRELKHSPGQWNRVFRSVELGGGVNETEASAISTTTLYADDVNRKLLIELYRVPDFFSSSPARAPVLCGYVETTVSSLTDCIVVNAPLEMTVRPDGELRCATLEFDQGTIIGENKGDRKAILFRVNGVRWFRNDKERVKARKTGKIVEGKPPLRKQSELPNCW
eukprot:CAMPEP_0184688738 /NCGR_PEP_ID=MMETSP0312-20130426/30259_1 /TAXON_ID=31354 /ORGANISM="Compsopogon coeruleus, Strain SAG 36.94" /LENGTH=401 /DNA_ID=CAMNT_0027146001 /DNA_START=125 /DNA_END=1327 /DNA_ORIENTATION=-